MTKAEKENDDLLSKLKELHALLDDANTELIKCYQDMRDLEKKLQNGRFNFFNIKMVGLIVFSFSFSFNCFVCNMHIDF